MSFHEYLKAAMQFVSDHGDVVTPFGVSAVIAYFFLEINEEFYLSILRLLGRALRWLSDHFSLVFAWFLVCVTVFLSFLLFLQAFYGTPVSLFEFWVLFTGCLMSLAFERFYLSELKAVACAEVAK